MSDEFSVRFGPAVAAWVAKQAQGSVREKVVALRAAYEKGANSSSIDLAAYLVMRAPATFAAVSAALIEVVRLAPDFAPKSMCDIGAGPGTASFVASTHFTGLQRTTMIEADARFAALAKDLAPKLPFAAEVSQQSLWDPLEKSDLLIAGYVLAELPADAAARATLHFWQACEGVLVLVEPGTPQGFARIRACRGALLNAGANIIGPCTHDGDCPIQGDDWCHFKTRLARSRAHMHAKGGTVPFEDEAFCWLAVARFPVQRDAARIMAPPKASKAAVNFKLCSASGLHDEMIASRDKATYKRVRKLKWGDGFSRHVSGQR
jgi:ribosomal protein RSM22 (predicted rRNA methylase)